MGFRNVESDLHRAMSAAAWIIFLLLLKNLVLLLILAIKRRRIGNYSIPEDAENFKGTQRETIGEDWSFMGRIQRALTNETKYLPYFLVLLVFKFCSAPIMASDEHQYLVRVLVYGISFLIARYLHTIGFLFRLTYIRLLGFLISFLIIFAFSLDHVISMSKTINP